MSAPSLLIHTADLIDMNGKHLAHTLHLTSGYISKLQLLVKKDHMIEKQ